jgi:hypothetical protein
MQSENASVDDVLLALMSYEWIQYLPANRMATALKDTILDNRILSTLFRNSVADYKRDDFGTPIFPALSIYEVREDYGSRFYPLIGNIIFDIYFPIKLFRKDAEKAFNSVIQAFVLIIQQPSFFNKLNDNLIPLPPTDSNIYNDVINYKKQFGGILTNFAEKIKSVSPIQKMIGGPTENIGGVYKAQLTCTYSADLSDYYNFLIDYLGINFDYDPNKEVYPPLDNFSVLTEQIII